MLIIEIKKMYIKTLNFLLFKTFINLLFSYYIKVFSYSSSPFDFSGTILFDESSSIPLEKEIALNLSSRFLFFLFIFLQYKKDIIKIMIITITKLIIIIKILLFSSKFLFVLKSGKGNE